MEDKNEPILRQMEETRTSLTDKVERIEHLVSEKVQAGADVVEHATDAANAIVANVKETVHDVTEKVEEVVQGVTDSVERTLKSVASIFDVRKQTERHPWIVVGVSAVTGCLIGNLLGRRSQSRSSSYDAQAPRLNYGNGSAHVPEPAPAKRSAESEKPRAKGWFTEHLEHLKGLAVSTLLGAVRDMARRAIPGEVGTRLAAEVDSLTTHLGGEPIRSSILPEEREGKDEDGGRKESSFTEAGARSTRETSRLRSDGAGLR